MIVDIYRSSKKEGLYIYLPSGEAIDSIPENLAQQFGVPVFSMKLKLHAQRKLARANVTEVMSAIEAQGFYLQMPPIVGVNPLSHANTMMPASKN